MKNKSFHVLVAVVLCGVGMAQAQTGLRLATKPLPQDRVFEATADARLFGQTQARDNNADFTLSQYESEGRFQVFSSADATVRLGYSVDYLGIRSDDARLPDQLWDQSAAVGVSLAAVDGWMPAFTLGGGYSGDTPYGDGAAWYAKSAVGATRMIDKDSYLNLALDYDGNRSILPDVPLPVVAYSFLLANLDLRLTVGFPINGFVWTPMEKLTVEAEIIVLYSARASINYELSKQWKLFARFERRTQAYHLDELEGTNDRLLFEQKRVEVGVTWSPCSAASLIVAGGYAFDQEFTTGFDSRDTNDLVELDNAPYLRAGLQLTL